MTAVTVVLAAVSVSVQAKTLFVGITGGVEAFFPGGGNQKSYDPLAEYRGWKPMDIAKQHHGLDALAVRIGQHIGGNSEFLSRIFSRDTISQEVIDWLLTNGGGNGATIYIAGYSAGGGIALDVAYKLSVYHPGVRIEGLALIDEISLAVNLVTDNVRSLYVYYQKGCLNKTDPKCWSGTKNYGIQNPEYTEVLKFLIDKADHKSIDNDRRVWESLATLLGYTAVDGVTVPKLLRWHIAGWQAGGYKANNQYADYRPIDYVAVVMPGSVRGVFGMKILGYSDKAQVPYKVIDFESIYNVGRSGVPGDFAYCETSLDYTSGQYLLPCQVLQRVRHWQNLGSLDYGSFVGSWTVSTTYMRLDPASPFDDYTCRDSQGRLLLALRVGGSYDTESSCYREVLVVYDGEGSLWQAVGDSGSSDAPETTDGADTPDESTDKRSSGGSSGGGGALSWPILLSFLVFLRKRRS